MQFFPKELPARSPIISSDINFVRRVFNHRHIRSITESWFRPFEHKHEVNLESNSGEESDYEERDLTACNRREFLSVYRL